MTGLKRILLVEDSGNDIELILTSLSENHLANEVVVTRDGEEALDYLYYRGIFKMRQEGQPILILLDLKLPKLDGLEVLAQLKSDAVLRFIPIVVLSSSNEEPDLRRCYELGTNAYVVKPINFQEFVEVIKQIGLFWAIVNQPPPPLYWLAVGVNQEANLMVIQNFDYIASTLDQTHIRAMKIKVVEN